MKIGCAAPGCRQPERFPHACLAKAFINILMAFSAGGHPNIMNRTVGIPPFGGSCFFFLVFIVTALYAEKYQRAYRHCIHIPNVLAHHPCKYPKYFEGFFEITVYNVLRYIAIGF
jgi:hypothetical protein